MSPRLQVGAVRCRPRQRSSSTSRIRPVRSLVVADGDPPTWSSPLQRPLEVLERGCR